MLPLSPIILLIGTKWFRTRLPYEASMDTCHVRRPTGKHYANCSSYNSCSSFDGCVQNSYLCMPGLQDNQPTLAAGTIRARLPNPWHTLLMDTCRTVTSAWFDGATVGKNTISLIFIWGFTLINDYCAIKVQTTKDKHHRQLIIIHVFRYSLCYFPEVLGARPWGSPSS